ncbi:FAD-dependent oxidoreductase [Saprospiraceae bacterium]|jgi:NADPH-dependent glutamate synthase beta subunit-like oxidoreductase|nr:FAD-dependent oxidoreductase [Saprospiraceae bacterium]
MKHIIAIFGGAVSGAEAAYQLSQRGIRSVVFEQNVLPYGKIEDGLPKWHAKLRDQEEAKINDKLNHELIDFVPGVSLGKDIDFKEVLNDWGFSAILLATGAWKDRPLPIEGIDNFIGRGFYYQNPFIYWFNHFHEPTFKGENIEIRDEAIVVGGGLASIDVCKALMMLSVEKALKERGIETNVLELDKGINRKLDLLGLTLEDLGLKGCTLYYRRRIKDMPLSPVPADTPDKLPKVEQIREKILNNARKKFLFNVEELHLPISKIEENGELKGIVFQKTEIVNGKAQPIKNSDKAVFSQLIISSIGSVSLPINGIPMKWQNFDVDKAKCCRIQGYKNVFALGNAVTGRGNIIESKKHGRAVTAQILDDHFIEPGDLFVQKITSKSDSVLNQTGNIVGQIERFIPPNNDQMNEIYQRVSVLQNKAGYDGDFMKWVEKSVPMRLENMVGH